MLFRSVLWGGRLQAGQTVEVPDDRFIHLFVARGGASLDGAGDLAEADAVRLTGAGSRRLTADVEGAEVLIWAMS